MEKTVNVRQNIFDNGAKNPFYEGELCGRDKEYIKGYDFCAEQQIEGFFNDIWAYSEEFASTGVDVHDIDLISVNADNLDDEFISKLDKNTVLFGTIHDCLLDYIERKRDETVMAMIETQKRGKKS